MEQHTMTDKDEEIKSEIDTIDDQEIYETIVVEVQSVENFEEEEEGEELDYENYEALDDQENESIIRLDLPIENTESFIENVEVERRLKDLRESHKRKIAALEADYEQEILGLQSKLQKARKKRPDFKCDICELTFSSVGSLNKHKRTAKNCRPPDKNSPIIEIRKRRTLSTDDDESFDEIDQEEVVQSYRKRLRMEIQEMKANHNEKVLDLEYQIQTAKAPDLKCDRCGSIFFSVGHFNKHRKNTKCSDSRKLVISGDDGIEISVEVQEVQRRT